MLKFQDFATIIKQTFITNQPPLLTEGTTLHAAKLSI